MLVAGKIVGNCGAGECRAGEEDFERGGGAERSKASPRAPRSRSCFPSPEPQFQDQDGGGESQGDQIG